MEPFNLVDLVRSYLTRDVSNRIASSMGEDRIQTQAGIDAGIPGLLSGFDNVASTPDGAKRLSSVVDGADTGILSNLTGLFGAGFSADRGVGVLQSLLGGSGLSDLTGGIGRSSGLTGKAVMSLLGYLVPIALGALRKVKDSRGLDASGLASMLAGQRSNINAAMPEGMRTAYTREPLRDASREPAYETERYPRRAETHTKPSASWVLPALLGLGLLGLLWYGVSRSAVRAGRDEGAVAERTARMHETYRQKGMASFESLKSKYQSVIQEARNQGIQISKLQEKDGKLLIEGTAPSTEAANRVWNEIKRIDPNMQGIIANFPVSTSVGFIPKMPSTTGETASQAADTTAANTKSADNTKADTSKNAVTRAKPGLSDTMTASDKETYTVKRGDTLGTISKHFYGDSKEYKRILDANSDSINNANQLEVGQQLQIPMK